MLKWFKAIGFFFVVLILLLGCVIAYIKWGMAPEIPKVKKGAFLFLNREKGGDNFYRIGNSWLRKTKNGLWEEYVEGEPFKRGVIKGKLEADLLYTQEEAFVEQIQKLIPSKSYLSFLGLFTRVFNRNLEKYVAEEFRQEIFGESLSAPKDFDYISPAYDRMLNYHAAHDIGHALQNLALVGCSSFSVWGAKSQDSSLLIGRNLDFYLGDKFAQDKIVYFCKPTTGNKFALITWAGFIGCVSGMNEWGLTVTINAAKSDVPSSATTPISILAREILQYASNIEEAYAIAKKRKTFVCETLMIGSAADHKTAIIEKSIAQTALFKSDTNYILCTNHYQSEVFSYDHNNLQSIKNTSTQYRFDRLTELLGDSDKISYSYAADVLRNQKGINGKEIGIGNEKALNQLIAHHGIVFKPEERKFWISANPYQLGEFVCYDLDDVFLKAPGMKPDRVLQDTTLVIHEDEFLATSKWANFGKWRLNKDKLKAVTTEAKRIDGESEFIRAFTNENSELWETYALVGDYFAALDDRNKALDYYNIALAKEVNDSNEIFKLKEKVRLLK